MILSFSTPITITLQLDGEDTDKYPQVKIFDSNSSLVTTLDLTHVSGGLYSVSYNLSNGEYTGIFTVYSDSNHTSKDTYYDYIISENIVVTDKNISNTSISDISTSVWEELLSNHSTAGTMGLIMSELIKLTGYKVTKSGNTITIYEADGTTVWRRYDLTDGGRVQI